VLQALLPTSEAKQQLQAVNNELLANEWWKDGVPAKMAAHGNALVALTTQLLGFDLAAPGAAPAPPEVAALDAMLAQDSFDGAVAAQLLQTAGQLEKRTAGAQLAQAVQDFKDLSVRIAATPDASKNLKRQRKEVQKSLQRVNAELARYSARVGNTGSLAQAQEAILKSTASYLAKSGS
jgi:septal ring factor EnvC (AmiA/AmiB activator)